MKKHVVEDISLLAFRDVKIFGQPSVELRQILFIFLFFIFRKIIIIKQVFFYHCTTVKPAQAGNA